MQKLINSNETYELPDEHFEVKHNEKICLFIAYLFLQESLHVHSQNVPSPTANQHHEFGYAHLTAIAISQRYLLLLTTGKKGSMVPTISTEDSPVTDNEHKKANN